MNFLIAEVSMTYDRIKSLGPCLMFQKKQELNFFTQKIFKFYGKNDPFKSLIFVSPREVKGEEDQYEYLMSFRDESKQNMNKLRQDVSVNQKKLMEQFSANQSSVSQTEFKVNKMQE